MRKTADSDSVLAFFRSERSGPARRMDSLIAHLARTKRDCVQVTVVDVDSQPELARRFRIKVVPTLVLVKEHRVVARLEGRASARRIDRMLSHHSAVPRRMRSAILSKS